mgnify:CR=1 FL=1
MWTQYYLAIFTLLLYLALRVCYYWVIFIIKVMKRQIWPVKEKNKNFKGLPFSYHFIRFWQALLPTSIFDYIFGEVVGIFHAMDNFTGRKQ